MGVSLLRDGSRTRSLENVGCARFIHFDIDLRTLNETRDDVLQRLKQLLPPWIEIRDSGGGGFHLIIYLKEPVEADTEEFERAGDARSRLTRILCADPAPNHAAALLRKVGTTNFKYESPQLCQVIRPGEPVDITEVEEFLDQLGDAPLFAQVERATNGHDRAAGEPRLRESKAPVDAEARLAAMQYQGSRAMTVFILRSCTARRRCCDLAYPSTRLWPKSCEQPGMPPPTIREPRNGIGAKNG